MQTVYWTRGIPASGKTTWAKLFVDNNPSYIRINKDDIRHITPRNSWESINEYENLIRKLHDNKIREKLELGLNVVIDNTHISYKYPQYYLDLFKEWGLDDIILLKKDFTEVSLDICLYRNSVRNELEKVPEKVIIDMYNQLKRNWKEKPKNINKPDCVIIDIDGTLANIGGRNPYDRDFINDKPVEQVVLFNRMIVSEFHGKNDNRIFLFSGRSRKYLNETIRWLNKHEIYYDNLVMRPENDNRSDDTLKREFYENYIKGYYNVLFIVDDRPKVVRMWRSLGLFVFDVNQSGVEF